MLGVAVDSIEIRLIEVSRSGCLLESTRQVAPGVAGEIRIAFEGRVLVEALRVTRCKRIEGAGPLYRLGAEFIRTPQINGSSLRQALYTSTEPRAGDEETWGIRLVAPVAVGSISYMKEDSMREMVNRLVKDDAGQDLIEYALLAAFVALGSVAALILLGPAIKTLFDTVVTKLGQASAAKT